MKQFICLVLITSFLFALQTETLWAQSASSQTSPAYYFSGDLRKAEQLKIQVQVWGHVKKPGLYIVPDDINMLSLISLAGGPTENARLDDVKLIRTEPDTVYIVDMERFTETGNSNLIPGLRPDDTVMVPGSAFYSFGKVVTFISQLATIATAYLVISDIGKD